MVGTEYPCALSLSHRIRNSHPITHLPPSNFNQLLHKHGHTDFSILSCLLVSLWSWRDANPACGPCPPSPPPPNLTKWDNCEDRLFVVKKNTNRWEGTRSGRARGYGHPLICAPPTVRAFGDQSIYNPYTPFRGSCDFGTVSLNILYFGLREINIREALLTLSVFLWLRLFYYWFADFPPNWEFFTDFLFGLVVRP